LEDESSSEDFSSADDEEDSPCDLDEIEYGNYQLRLLCKVMEEGKYPGMSLGNYESLNKNVDQLIKYNSLSDEVRGRLKVDYTKDLEWQTFRDANEQAKSVFFHYTWAPRQGLSINDEWIPKKEVLKLFEAGMYERAHASWSSFDPRFFFV
jgi:hypothetical protein